MIKIVTNQFQGVVVRNKIVINEKYSLSFLVPNKQSVNICYYYFIMKSHIELQKEA